MKRTDFCKNPQMASKQNVMFEAARSDEIPQTPRREGWGRGLLRLGPLRRGAPSPLRSGRAFALLGRNLLRGRWGGGQELFATRDEVTRAAVLGVVQLRGVCAVGCGQGCSPLQQNSSGGAGLGVCGFLLLLGPWGEPPPAARASGSTQPAFLFSRGSGSFRENLGIWGFRMFCRRSSRPKAPAWKRPMLCDGRWEPKRFRWGRREPPEELAEPPRPCIF